MNRRQAALIAVIIALIAVVAFAIGRGQEKSALVYMTDFGLKDGAVSTMKGVASGVDPELRMYDLTHEIPNYNVWEGAYRLMQTSPYWPSGTVFVCVVDPGVGTERGSIVMKTESGHYFVSPDNGLLTLVADEMGIREVREIDERVNRLPGSEGSHTFYGRDVYSYTGARLASRKISFEEVGPVLKEDIVRIPYQKPEIRGSTLLGNIPVLDVRYGNVWTNIDKKTFEALDASVGEYLMVRIFRNEDLVYEGKMPYENTFGDVSEGRPLVYLNELMNVSFALYMDSFSERYGIGSGPEWSVEITGA
jgi:hypothetical protein